MARRKVKQQVDNKKLIIEAFNEMAREKSIDRDLLQGIVEETLSAMVRKKYGLESNFDIIVNMEKGDIEIYLMREIVEEVENPELQISAEEVREVTGNEPEIGDDVSMFNSSSSRLSGLISIDPLLVLILAA